MRISMNRDEFLRQFRESLAGKVPENVINENAAYYRNYINNQVSGGMREEDVLRGLGDPRLLAKTIEESSKFTRESSAEQRHGGANSEIYGDTYSNNSDYSRNGGYEQTVYGNGPYMRHKVTPVPLWLGVLIIFAIMGLIVVTAFNIFVILLPFILVGVLASILYRIIKLIFR